MRVGGNFTPYCKQRQTARGFDEQGSRRKGAG
jgi:hypothetical protein